MNLILSLKRPFIWISRFRHRCGYGVHSPFAFDLITTVIYEKSPYYAYKTLLAEEKKQRQQRGKDWQRGMRKVNRLLFRFVNKIQPRNIVDVGLPCASSLYLQAARVSADYTSASCLEELFLEAGVPVDFLYIHDYKHPELVEEVFRVCAPRTTSGSVFVIEGIRYTKSMRTLWKRLQEDEQVGITFDLYDVGILFFDRMKIKQHYIVNF